MATRAHTTVSDMSSSFTEKLYDQIERLRDVEIKLREQLYEANSKNQALKREIDNLIDKTESSKTRRTKKGQVRPRGQASAPRSTLSVGRHFVEPSDDEASENEVSHDDEHSAVSPRRVGAKSKRQETVSRHEPPLKKPRHNTPKLQQVFELLSKDAKLQQGILFSVGTSKDDVSSKNAFELFFQESTNGIIYWLRSKDNGKLYRSAQDAVSSTEVEQMPSDELDAYKMLLVRTDKGQMEDLWSLYERWSKAEARKQQVGVTQDVVPTLRVTPPDHKPATPSTSPMQSPAKKSTKQIQPNPLAKSEESDDEGEQQDEEEQQD